ncbi:unnamed protein product [Ectocarpus fasciculatus]
MKERYRRDLPREEVRHRRRRHLACLCTGVASLLLILVAFVLQAAEGRLFPLLMTAAAFVLQVVCGAIVWSNLMRQTAGYGQTTVRPSQASWKSGKGSGGGGSVVGGGGGTEVSRPAGGGGGGGSPVTAMEQGSAACAGRRSARMQTEVSRRDVRSSRRIAVGAGDGTGGATDADEESFNRHFALETPLQQAARTLEFILDKYSPDQRTQEKLEMVLNIISQPEDLNMVTIQSIMNADLDSSTTEWIEAQLSAGSSLGVANPTGIVKWNRLREGLQGVVHRLASEFSEAKLNVNGMDTGMTSQQLKRQHEVGRAYNMEKAASGRSRRQSANINVSQLMTLPGARSTGGAKPGAGSILYEVDENSQMDEETEDEEHAEHEALLDLMPMWPGIAPEAQKALVDHITTRHFLDWGFDVFKLEELSGGHALWYTGTLTLYHYNFVGVFNVNPANLSRFLTHVEQNYCYDPAAPNPYHTSVHAADVTLTVAHFCENSIIASGIKALQGFALLVAAIVHDYRHRGVNNGYLIKIKDALATRYNDGSVLENFHISEAFKVLYDEETNILDGLSADDARHFRQLVIKIILATDLAHGFEYVARFKASTTSKGGRRASIVPDMGREGTAPGCSIGPPGSPGGMVGAPKGGPTKDPLQAQILLMQMVIKVADVSHPMKPWDLHERWTRLITEEFHRQGDLEAEKGVPVSPLCSREGHNQAKSQCDFVNFVVRPCATVFSEFCKDKIWVTTLESNYRR